MYITFKKTSHNFSPLTKYSNKIFRDIQNTPPIECNPEGNVEIHTLLEHNELNMYLLAIKSFLRFYNDLAIVVHSDRSLKKADIATLKRHIFGIRVYSKRKADNIVEKTLHSYPESRFLRKLRPIIMQVFDYSILSKRNKLIGFDSDILVLEKPEEIINWVKTENMDILYNHENSITVPGRMLKRENIACLGDVNAGLVCYYKDMFDFEKIEKTLKKIKCKPDWFYAQAHFDYSIYDSKYSAKKLPYERYPVRKSKEMPPDPVAIHFIMLYRFVDSLYQNLAKKVICDLKNR